MVNLVEWFKKTTLQSSLMAQLIVLLEWNKIPHVLITNSVARCIQGGENAKYFTSANFQWLIALTQSHKAGFFCSYAIFWAKKTWQIKPI